MGNPNRKLSGTPQGGEWAEGSKVEAEGDVAAGLDGWADDGELTRTECRYKEWFDTDGELHRDDGPAIEYPDGSSEWFQRGRHHRDDGPAIESADGSGLWFQRGELHRDDGPAVERADGSGEWWREGKRVEPPS